jgi:endonuclease/exonuclease/phosphatase family metal-dependent hydrolase
MVKVVTLNILGDLHSWPQRRGLLRDGLAPEHADLIGLQEVRVQEATGSWLAEQLGMPYVYTVPHEPRPPEAGPQLAVAILSRHPFVRQDFLDLQSQGRRAHYVEVNIDGHPLVFCNGHYFWKPGPAPERRAQIQLLLRWLSRLPPTLPVIAVGDFNATPGTPEIDLMCACFRSAYAVCQGREPEYTCPTPLSRRRRPWRALGRYLVNLWVNGTIRPWRGTLDYIFISPHLAVRRCNLILTAPAPNNNRLYPSDHFGIAAELLLAD